MVKITIISPCYNGEKHLIPYIEGLLSQTHSNVEFIFVNDGSTDRTEEIINSYSEKFKAKGWDYIYVKQEIRGGQAKAINQGLKIFTGNYLCCIDSDDIIMPTYLEDMSSFLEKNKDFGIVFPWVEVIEEKTNKHIQYFKRVVPTHIQDTLFDNFILQQNHGENYVFYASFMMRSSVFLEIYPKRTIYEGLSGQNAQLILPVLYNYKCGYLHKILYKAVARKNSDSRLVSRQDFLLKTYSWEDIYCNVIKIIPNMPEYEKAYYFKFVKDYWQNVRGNFSNNVGEIENKEHKNIFANIFSIRNEYKNGIKRKNVTIFGIKIKFKIAQNLARERERERERESNNSE